LGVGLKSAIGVALASCAGLAARSATAGPRTPTLTHVACIGDSITAGAGASSPSKDYPSNLQRLLGPAAQVRNFGHGGATMLTTGDVPYARQSEYAAATAFVSGAGPGAVVAVIVMLGTNDSKPWNWAPDGGTTSAQFAIDCAAIFDHFSSLPTRPVVYVALPPAAFGNPFGIRGGVIHDEIIPILEQVATRKRLPVIDLNTPTAAFSGEFVDAVHPSDSGYERIAHEIYSALLAADASAKTADPIPPEGGSTRDSQASAQGARGGCSGCAVAGAARAALPPWIGLGTLSWLRLARRRGPRRAP